MRSDHTRKIITGLSLLMILSLYTNQVCAQTENIQITDIKHQLIDTTQIGTRTAHYYSFFITFSNTGDKKSSNITVFLEDPELNARLEVVSFELQPDQNKTFIYENWPTTLLGQVTINVTYQPSDLGIPQTKSNTGIQAYTFLIGTDQNTNETPGFQFLWLIIAILFILNIFRRSKA